MSTPNENTPTAPAPLSAAPCSASSFWVISVGGCDWARQAESYCHAYYAHADPFKPSAIYVLGEQVAATVFFDTLCAYGMPAVRLVSTNGLHINESIVPHTTSNHLRKMGDLHNLALSGMRIESRETLSKDDMPKPNSGERSVCFKSSNLKSETGDRVCDGICHNSAGVQDLPNVPAHIQPGAANSTEGTQQ